MLQVLVRFLVLFTYLLQNIKDYKYRPAETNFGFADYCLYIYTTTQVMLAATVPSSLY